MGPPSIVKMLRVNTGQDVGALGPHLVSLAGLAEVGLAVRPDVGQPAGVLAGVVTDVVRGRYLVTNKPRGRSGHLRVLCLDADTATIAALVRLSGVSPLQRTEQ